MPQTAPSEFARHLRQVRAAETAALAFRDREARRRSGVAWSGFAADPLAPRPDDELQANAQDRLHAAQAWRLRPEGAFLVAIAAVQRAAERLHAGAEQARAGALRGLGAERAHCTALLEDLRRQVQTLAQGLSAAGDALDLLD